MPGWAVLRPYLAGLIVALAVAGSVILLRERGRTETLITIEAAPEGQTVTVFVGGAVNQPGVYTLARGDRVDAALTAAGGLSAEADPDAINRAVKLRDEAQIIVPRRGEPKPTTAPRADNTRAPSVGDMTTPATSAPVTTGNQPTLTGSTTGRINVNIAPVSELEKLPGVGPRLAQQIVDYRTANGPFQTADDLAKVKGISDRMVASWADLIAFGP